MKSKNILRKALSVFMMLIMAFSVMAVGVNAVEVGDVVNSGNCGESATWTLTKNGDDGEGNDTYTLTISGTGAMADYTYYLAASPSPWANSADAITNVVIENGVTSIGSYAFSQCTTLTSVTIPDSVTSIGSYAFQDCWVLGAVTIPSSVTSIGNSAFYSCYDLTTVTIPSSVTSIGNQAFYGCYDLTTVTIPSSVTSIGNNAFAGCTDLETVNLPCNWDENPLYTFGGNVSTTTAKHNIENGTCTVCGSTFTCGENVIWILDDGTLTISGTGAMADYTNSSGASPSPWADSAGAITNVVIGDDVTSIGSYAFSGLENLTSVTIPSSITTIGEEAFLDCTSLTKVNLPCNWDDSIFTFDESVEKNIAHKSSGPATSTTPEKCTVCGYIISPATGSNNNSSSGGSSSSSSKESPNIEGKNGKKGWSAISDVIEDTKEGEKVVIDMNDATELPKNILKEIKGKDIAIVLNMDNGFIWTINGKDVENPKTIDMGVKKGTRIPVKVINEVTGESEYIEITLSHNGDFGFKAVLTVDMGKNNKGNFANLYYYNGKGMDIICSDEIDENGKADLTFTHASEYVIVIDDTDHTDLSAGESIKVEEIVLL